MQDPSFYATVAQVVPILFLATVVEAAALWRFARPLLDGLSPDERSRVLSLGSSFLLGLTILVFVGEAQAFYALSGDVFLIDDEWPIYAAMWASGLALALPVVLAQVRLAALAKRRNRGPTGHLIVAGIFLLAYLAAAVSDLVC